MIDITSSTLAHAYIPSTEVAARKGKQVSSNQPL
jgi:hypothetical protein